jgi:hypothetical protein
MHEPICALLTAPKPLRATNAQYAVHSPPVTGDIFLHAGRWKQLRERLSSTRSIARDCTDNLGRYTLSTSSRGAARLCLCLEAVKALNVE